MRCERGNRGEAEMRPNEGTGVATAAVNKCVVELINIGFLLGRPLKRSQCIPRALGAP